VTFQKPVLGGMLSSLIHVLIVTPVIWTLIKERELRRGRLPGPGRCGRAPSLGS
jgi:Cu(I)/Ag(I) efflux system membrane protein CusA/SilA